MKDVAQTRVTATAVMFLALSACGGGSGESPAATAPVAAPAPAPVQAPVQATADGLGMAGHTPDTVKIPLSPTGPYGTVPGVRLAVGLSDDGRALAAWQLSSLPRKTDRVIVWAQSNLSGVFSAPAILSQAGSGTYLYRLTMRMNTAGHAVLGFVKEAEEGVSPMPKVARFIQGSGWDPVSYDPTAGFALGKLATAGASWDLTLLDDNSFTYSTGTKNSVSVAQTAANGQQKRMLETELDASGTVSEYSYFAPRGNGDGLLYTAAYTIEGSTSKAKVSARLAGVNGALRPFSLGTFGALCFHPNYEHPMVAATTSNGEGVLAFNVTETSGCETNELQLVRVYTRSAIRVETARLNSPRTYLPAAPAVVVDKAGNALAVWVEAIGKRGQDSETDTVRLMWSRSPYGGSWSTPEALMPAGLSTGLLRTNPVALAMNAEGQAVAAVRLGNMNPTISVARFDFKSGWGAWKMVANKQDLSPPAVAINTSGQAVVIYSGFDAERVDGKAPVSVSTDALRVFALRF